MLQIVKVLHVAIGIYNLMLQVHSVCSDTIDTYYN